MRAPEPLARLIGLAFLLIWGAGLVIAAAPLFAPGGIVAAVGQFAFGGLCHQLPHRSFALDGHVMSVCHRCSGIYLGIALGGALAALGVRVDPRRRAIWIAVGVVMLIQVSLGWLSESLDLVPLRIATGLLVGGWAGLAVSNVPHIPPETTPLTRAPHAPD